MKISFSQALFALLLLAGMTAQAVAQNATLIADDHDGISDVQLIASMVFLQEINGEVVALKIFALPGYP